METSSAAAHDMSSKAEQDNLPPPPPPPPPSINGDQEKKQEDDEYSRSRHGRFRFKSSKSKSKSGSKHDDHSDSHHHHHNHHHRHHHRKRRKTSHGHNDDDHDYDHDDSLHYNPPLSPNSAFRESLFDALADDEGAAFWESVYGQPIHTYPVPSVPKGPNGELEQMSDEEYAAYVRARMWERTHEGMMEAREQLRREKERKKREEERRRKEEEERLKFERAVEESLRRGRERRRMKAWRAVWEEYRRSWDELNALVSTSTAAKADEKRPGEKISLRNCIFWPVESGKRKDISREAVEEFMRHAPPPPPTDTKAREDDTPPPDFLLTTLKAERVRWHPDKIQHRYGALGIDESVMRSVTEVFQIIDRMWSEERERLSKARGGG